MATNIRPPANTYSTSVTGGAGYPGDVATGGGVRPLVKVIDSIDPRETPFMSSITKGPPVKFRQLEWWNRVSMPFTVTLAEAIDTSETAWDLASGHGDRLQKGHVLLVPVDASGNAEEIVIVTDDADGTDTRDVVRAKGGTSAVAHDTGTVVRVIGIAMNENSNHPIGQYIFGDRTFTYVQRLATKIQVDMRADVQATVEDPNGNVFERRLMEKAEDAKLALEQALLLGQRDAGDPNVASAGSMMSGIRHFAVLSGNDYNLGGSLLNPYDIEEALYDQWLNVGANAGKKIITDMTTARILDTTLNARRQFTADTDTVNLTAARFKFRVGDVEIIPSRWMLPGEMIGYNPKYVTYHAFEGLDWHFARKRPGVETDGDYTIGSISGDFVLMNQAIETSFRIRNFDTNIDNYPVDLSV